MKRIEKAVQKFKEKDLDAIFISSFYNRRYLSGFTGSSCYLFITANNRYLLTDFRYIEQATSQCPQYEIIDFTKKGLTKTVKDLVIKDKVKRLGFEETQTMVDQYNKYISDVNDCQWLPIGTMIEKIRMIKDAEEIRLIEKAEAIGDKAFMHILDYIKPGMTEKEAALELEFAMRKEGASGLSFETIMASGVRSSLPHGAASDKIIEKGDFVTMDFGCIYEGYCSDMTRTIVVGKANEKQKEIYNIVLKAQLEAADKIGPNILGKTADAYARDIINAAGYKEQFGHSLGHGVGLDVHEQPRFSPLSEDHIEPGMIISIEPGIYIPDFGGVRIEDIVLITEDGNKNLAHSPKELIELG